MGANTEFLSSREAGVVLAKRPTNYTMVGTQRTKPGECTDDTQLILATLQAFISTGTVGPDALLWRLRAGFSSWIQSMPPDAGIVVQRSLQLGSFDAWVNFPGSSAGNGALMRAVSINALALAAGDLLTYSVLAGAATHLDPLSVWSCLFLNVVIDLLMNGETWDRALSLALGVIRLPETFHRVNTLLQASLIPEKYQDLYTEQLKRDRQRVEEAVLEGALGVIRSQGGFVVDTLRSALAHNVRTERYIDCVWRAARLGQDADTTASVAGALAASRGWRVPQRWTRPLRAGHSWGKGTLLDGWKNAWPLDECLPRLLDLQNTDRKESWGSGPRT